MFRTILSKLILAAGLLTITGFGVFWLTQSDARAADCASGSFSKSCNEIKCAGETLYAKCKKIDGSSVSSSLDNYLNCSTDIANCNGQLKCQCGSNCPSGSYAASCSCCGTKTKYNPQKEQSEQHLCCLCKNKKGKLNDTCLEDYTACTKDDNGTYSIWNDNGSLKCNK